MKEAIEQEREATLRDFAAVIFRRKGVVLGILLASLVALVWINATTPASWQSSARILVSRGEPESVYNSRYKLLSWEEDVNSEIEVLQSPAVGEKAQKLLKDQGAVESQGRPVIFDPRKVSASPSGKASVLVVNYTAPDPVEAREALRALTRAYIDWRGQERNLPVVEGFFQEELEGLRDRLSEWEQRRADFMTEEGIVDIDQERQSFLRQKEDVSYQLTQARARVADFAARLEAVRALELERRQDRNIEIAGIGDAEYNDDALLVNLRRELTTRRADYFDKLGRYTEDHPEVRAAKEVVEQLQSQYDNEIANYIRLLEARIEVAQARVNSLEATGRAFDEQMTGLPDQEARLAQYDRIIEALKKDYSTMTERQVMAKVETTGRPEWNVILLSPASEAQRQRTRDYVRLALVPLFAILVGLALAFMMDGFDHSIKDATEAEQHLRVPVLGSISRIR